MDASGNVIQLTKDSYINNAYLVLPNNTYLTAVDAAGTGTVNLIKASTDDVPVLGDGAETYDSSAPTEDEGIANKSMLMMQ